MAKEQAFARTGVIAAIATGLVDAAIGIVRLSGKESWELIGPCLAPSPKAPTPRRTYRTAFVDPRTAELMDEVLVAFYAEGRSFTGERMVEVFGHGGVANLTSILGKLIEQGARQALPGEFSQRAFLNGRIDLTKALAIKAMAQSGNPFALIQARKHLGGEFSARLDAVRGMLVASIVDIEGEIELEEDTLNEGSLENVLLGALESLKALTKGPKGLAGEFRIVIAGAPNAGKSSLFNALLGKERSIVTPIPGTTRDFLEASLRLGPYEVLLIDTAGLSKVPSGPVERLGIEKTYELLREASFVIHLVDVTSKEAPLEAFEGKAWGRMVVGSKKDLLWSPKPPDDSFDISVSAKSGEGMDALKRLLMGRLEQLEALSKEEVFALGGFEQESLQCAMDHALRAIDGLKKGMALEAVSQELLDAVSCIDRISGKILDFELMEGLFATFCVGK